MNLRFDQNYSNIVLKFLITEQGDSLTVIAGCIQSQDWIGLLDSLKN